MEVDSFGLWPPKLGFLSIGRLKKPISKLGPQNFPPSLVELWLLGGSAEEDDFQWDSNTSPPSNISKFRIAERLLPSLLTLRIFECPDNLKEKIRMGFESSVNFNNQIYMPSSVPLSIISEKAYTFVSVNMNLP
ncbi:hypothetical protein Tco_0137575, partial [Tanacetum coccineum]